MAKINVRDRNKNFPDRKANWEYRFEIASIEGKRQSISKSGFRTKKDALDAGAQAYSEYNNTGKHFEPNNISVADYFALWYDMYVLKNTTMGTCLYYKGILKNYIIPKLGMYRLKDIDTCTIQKFINEINDEKKIVRRYLKTILTVVNEALDYAVQVLHYIQTNVANNISVPRATKVEKTKIGNLPTKQQIDSLLKQFKHSPYQYYGILICYYTGMRVAEAYGLTWDCIDLENKYIEVKQICKHIYSEDKLKFNSEKAKRRERPWCLGDPKTESSERIIRIGDTLVDALKILKQQQILNEKNYGSLYKKYYSEPVITATGELVYELFPYNNNEYDDKRANLVLVQQDGTYSGYNPAQYPKKVARTVLGINDFHFHQLRHYHATQLIEAGASVKDVQLRLGHANFQTTMNIYVNDTEEMQKTTVNIFEKTGELELTPTNAMTSSIYQLKPEETQSLKDIWKTIRTYDRRLIYANVDAKVCDEWENDFYSFAEWSANNGYKDGSKIRRINKKLGFYPENCCWVS